MSQKNTSVALIDIAASLGKLQVLPYTGEETLRAGSHPLGVHLRDFWRWSFSDLVSNATRGGRAEFLVAIALDIPLSGVRSDGRRSI